jgi:hypothetical protein
MSPLYLRKKHHSPFILIAIIVLTSCSAIAASKALPKVQISGVNCATEAKGQVHIKLLFTPNTENPQNVQQSNR